jgi:uncharacterized protein YgiM (DUF1202 family)
VRHLNVKLPAHPVKTGQARLGFPARKSDLAMYPLLPAPPSVGTGAGRQGLRLKGGVCGARSGQSKGGTAMTRLYRLTNLSITVVLSLFIFSCAQLGLQSKKEAPEPSTLPECQKNYKAEGIWPINRVYKTWVKYSPLDYKKGFDTAVMAVKTSGYTTISTDRDSGTINAEIISQQEDRKAYPIEIKLVKEQSSVTIQLSSSSAGGDSGKECFCRFYSEFEKSMKRSQPAPVAKQAAPPPKKSVEPVKDSPPPSPPPAAETPRASSPPTSPPTTLPKTQVAWAMVNLREGPGMKYNVVGKVKKGTTLAILEEKEGWYHVRLESGKEAWISKATTSNGAKVQPAPGPSPSSSSSKTPSPGDQSSKSKSPM